MPTNNDGYLYVSKPQHVEAIQWTGLNAAAVFGFTGRKIAFAHAMSGGGLRLLAGKDGAQGYVEVPVGHWIVHQPGDTSDIWPVEDAYFRAKYDRA